VSWIVWSKNKEGKISTKRALSSVILVAGVVMLAMRFGTTYAAPTAKTPGPPDEAGPTQPAGVTSEGIAVQAPPLANFINIWVDDVDNRKPAVAYNSKHDEYLVVWANDRGATKDIYAQRVTGDGTLKSWFTVVSAAGEWYFLPDVAYSPVQDEYLIVYTYQYTTNDFDIYARRVKWDGADLGLPQYQQFIINVDGDKQWVPAVTYNSQHDEYLVVYENWWAGGLRDIDAQRVRASDGQLLGPASGYNVATAPNTVRRLPDVAYNAARDEYLVAYTYQASVTNGDIYGKIATFNFGILSSEKIICADSYNQDSPAVAAGPNEYLVVWEDSALGTSIAARRVSGDGILQGSPGGFCIACSGSEIYVEPGIAYGNIYGYLVTWRLTSGSASDDDIYGRFVKPGQDAPSDSQFVIDDNLLSQREPALACGTHGDCLVVQEDNYSVAMPMDYEIRGRFVLAHHVYLPLILRNSP
jgi:hypothetical protein